MLYFFLSYARGDDDEYVQRFYRDLCVEVRVLAGLNRAVQVGFLDNHSIDLGQPWEAALVDALSTCHTFLALCAPAYFLSEACGKEWAIFQERSARYAAQHGTDPAALIPLAWVSPRRMREPAQTLQYRHDALGEAYANGGLRQLLRLQRNRDEYLDFVSAVAERIMQAVESPVPPPAERPDFSRVRSAFSAAPLVTGPNGAWPATRGTPEPAGSNHVYFVLAAPSVDEAAGVRTDLQYYGSRPHDWAPYRPELRQPLGEHAVQIASGRDLNSALATIEQLEDCIEQARRHNRVVVVLVDVWSTRLDRHRTILQRYDQSNDSTTAVIVPWSRGDAEIQRKDRTLTDALRHTMANNSLRRDVLFRPRVPTHEEFGTNLSEVLEVARNRVFARGNPHRRPDAPSLGGRPILEGP